MALFLKFKCAILTQKVDCSGWVHGWVDGWVDGWVGGSKSRVKDCLQQSKMNI